MGPGSVAPARFETKRFRPPGGMTHGSRPKALPGPTRPAAAPGALVGGRPRPHSGQRSGDSPPRPPRSSPAGRGRHPGRKGGEARGLGGSAKACSAAASRMAARRRRGLRTRERARGPRTGGRALTRLWRRAPAQTNQVAGPGAPQRAWRPRQPPRPEVTPPRPGRAPKLREQAGPRLGSTVRALTLALCASAGSSPAAESWVSLRLWPSSFTLTTPECAAATRLRAEDPRLAAGFRVSRRHPLPRLRRL